MRYAALAISLALLACLAGCSKHAPTPLRVFHADSLARPFQQMEQAFERQHPGVDVQRESYGSAVAIRQVTELGRPADLIASADYLLIDHMMIAKGQAADWNILFARNSIVIAWLDPQKALTADNWADVLSRGGERAGLSDPNQDPCGYRTLFSIYLAEKRLGKQGLFESFVLAHSNLRLADEGGKAVIQVPTDVAYRPPLAMRPNAADLQALLESGVIDCMFTYKSVAVQQKLGYLALPDEVNLGSAALAAQYDVVRARQYADRLEKSVLVQATPIVYGLTIPTSAPHPELALEFARFVLSDAGRRITEDNGQTPIFPAVYSAASRTAGAPFDLEQLKP
jgi:molybdate/tungstate transport system substrate-binding protein